MPSQIRPPAPLLPQPNLNSPNGSSTSSSPEAPSPRPCQPDPCFAVGPTPKPRPPDDPRRSSQPDLLASPPANANHCKASVNTIGILEILPRRLRLSSEVSYRRASGHRLRTSSAGAC